jgi:hypothetical protein
MRQFVTPGYIPAMGRWFWVIGSTVYPTKLVFDSQRLAANHAAMRAEREGGEGVVMMPGGRLYTKTPDQFDGDNGLRVVGWEALRFLPPSPRAMLACKAAALPRINPGPLTRARQRPAP